jgi:hypothetical protein
MKTLSKLLGLILSMSILPFAAASAQQLTKSS